MQGLLLINKPKNMTSFAVVARVKRLCQTKRVGHTGTLDPMATGVLPVLVGRATVLSGHLLEADKTYLATVQLGLTTNTYDITGTVLTTSSKTVTQQQLEQTLRLFLGEQLQVPPMFSALKQNGVRLYTLARQGEQIERPARKINIRSIQLLDFAQNTFKIKVTCSKGTYIRSLAHNIGERLQTGAVLTALQRVQTGSFSLESCVTLQQLEQQGPEPFLLPEEQAVLHYPAVEVSQKQAARFSNGGELAFNRLGGTVPVGQTVRICCKACPQSFIGLGFANAEKQAITVVCGVNFVQLPKGEPGHEQ